MGNIGIKAFRQIIKIPENHEVRIKLPKNIPTNEIAEIILIIRGRTDDFKEKINELKKCMDDKLFQEDLKEVMEDFKNVDLEDWNKSGI